jgi:acetyl-CoA carboxylase biotin carboxyl carrier protein
MERLQLAGARATLVPKSIPVSHSCAAASGWRVIVSLTHDDVERIIRLLDNSHFDELTLEMDSVKLELRRNGVRAAHAAAPPAQPPAAPAPALATAAVPAPAAAAGLLEVKAPMLGTFYRAAKPGGEPFVQVGAMVGPDDVIGIIEVMKLMNSIPAGVSGEVVEVLAKDGKMVEYDQVLLRIRPA